MVDEVLNEGLTILDPTTEPDRVEMAMACGLDTLDGKVAGIMDNNKQNAGKILDLVAEQVAKKYDLAGVVRKRKSDPTRGAPREMLDEMAQECHFAIVGVGD